MVRQRTREFPKASGHSTRCWGMCTGTQKLTGRLVNKLIDLQPVTDFLNVCGVDEVHVTYEDLETSDLVSD